MDVAASSDDNIGHKMLLCLRSAESFLAHLLCGPGGICCPSHRRTVYKHPMVKKIGLTSKICFLEFSIEHRALLSVLYDFSISKLKPIKSGNVNIEDSEAAFFSARVQSPEGSRI